jgi:hypothetical protein
MDTMERNSFSRAALAAMKDTGTPYKTQTTGMLNPEWVCLLQGYSTWWTDTDGLLDRGNSNIPTNPQELPASARTERIA